MNPNMQQVSKAQLEELWHKQQELQRQQGLNNAQLCKPQEVSKIEHAVCRLSVVINDLSIRVEKLTAKLDPVLSPVPLQGAPPVDQNYKDTPPISTLASRLTFLYDQACSITANLEQLEGRVEL